MFEFRRVPPRELTEYLRKICDDEAIVISDESLGRIARAGDGSVRDSLSLLERVIAFCGQEVDESPIYLYRQDDAEFYGVELEGEVYLARMVGGDLSLTFTGDVISGEFDDNGDVPRLPPLRLGGGLNWTNGDLTTWVKVLDVADQDDPGDFETETDGYTRWDAGVDYRWRFADERELYAFVRWKNIGDDEIRLSTSFLRNYAPESGESIEAGLRYSF